MSKQKWAEAEKRALKRYNKELEEMKSKPRRFRPGIGRFGVTTIRAAYFNCLVIEEYYEETSDEKGDS